MARRTKANRKHKTPWWKKQGLIVAGGWHPLTGRIRLGGKADNEEELYAWEYTEAHIRRLKQLGITLLVSQCDRGLGPTDQKHDQDLAKRQAALCHKHGIRHGSYMANTVYFESMLKDYPDCEDWVVKTHDGRMVHYGGEQTWRWVGCFNAPGWRQRTKREIRIAIEHVNTDWLHFDNLAVWPEPDSCHCVYCQEAFRRFLCQRYPKPEAQKRRFGFTADDFETFRAPNFYLRFIQPWNLAKINNPLMQDWIDFRCQTVTDYIQDMTDYARSLNPDVAIDSNGQSIWGVNQAIVHGVRQDHQARVVDMFWEENPDQKPGETRPEMRLLRMLRGMNYGRRLGKAVATAYRTAADLARNLTWCGHPGINMRWGYAEPKKAPLNEAEPGVMELLALFKRHTELYTPVQPAARTAVWRNYQSLAYDSFESHLSACVLEYTLAQKRIPFSIVLDQEMNGAGPKNVDLLIVPNMQHVNDEQMKVLQRFVRQGGRLLVTEKTGTFDGEQRRRSSNPLGSIFAKAAGLGREVMEETANFDPNAQFQARAQGGQPLYAEFGKGRAVYLPQIEYVHAARSLPGAGYNVHYSGCDTRYWQEPHNTDEILDALSWLSPDLWPFRVMGAGHLYVDYLQLEDGSLAVSMFRTDKAEMRALHFLVRSRQAPKKGWLYAPELSRPKTLKWTRREQGWEAVLPDVGLHAVVRWE